MGNARNWFWYFGCCVIGLCGCQGTNQDSSQSLADSFSSSRLDALHTRSLDPPYTLAILPLDNLSPNASLHWLGQSLSEMLANDLAKWPSLSVIAREAMGPVLREQWLQQRGFSSSDPTVDLGNIQGVRYLVRGGFHQHEDNLRIDLQIVDVETGVIVRSLSAQGRQSEIPRVEHDLAVQILNLFDAQLDSTTAVFLDQLEKETPEHASPAHREEKDGLHTRGLDSFGIHSVHKIDLQLSLERMTQHRMDAYGLAEEFWQKGWSAEMGQPLYRVWQSSEKNKESLPLLILPISLFMQPNKIAEVLKNVREGDIPLFVNLETDGFYRGQIDEAGISQLFFGYIRQPRRLFVRALNEQGELMAVYSKWSWHTAGILQESSPDRILFPMWPQPFLSGVAEFPVAWVERGEQHVTFDMVMVPISDEHLTIVLEPIVVSGTGEQKDHMQTPEDAALLLPLKNWIRMKWSPPITEALPVEGYLPANKRTVGALLHLQMGKIAKVQFLNVPHDALFSRSLEELKSDLLGYCVNCQNVEKDSSRRTLQAVRLQLTLEKDLHALRFGSRPH